MRTGLSVRISQSTGRTGVSAPSSLKVMDGLDICGFFSVLDGTTYKTRSPKIAIMCWANAGILSAVLLARRRQMTLTRCHFARRTNLIANCWFDVGPTPVAQQVLLIPT